MPPPQITEFLNRYEFFCSQEEYQKEPGDHSPVMVDFELQNPCGQHYSICDGAKFTMINNTLPLDVINRIVGSYFFRRLNPQSIREIDRNKLEEFGVTSTKLTEIVAELLQDGLHTYAHIEMFTEESCTLPDNAPYIIQSAQAKAFDEGLPDNARPELVRRFVLPIPSYVGDYGQQTGRFDPLAIEAQCNRLTALGVTKGVVCPLLPI